jgi:hypothetical protein
MRGRDFWRDVRSLSAATDGSHDDIMVCRGESAVSIKPLSPPGVLGNPESHKMTMR